MSFAEDDNYIMSLQKFGFQVATAELGSKIEFSIQSCLWASPTGSSAVKGSPMIMVCHLLLGAYEAFLNSLYC